MQSVTENNQHNYDDSFASFLQNKEKLQAAHTAFLEAQKTFSLLSKTIPDPLTTECWNNIKLINEILQKVEYNFLSDAAPKLTVYIFEKFIDIYSKPDISLDEINEIKECFNNFQENTKEILALMRESHHYLSLQETTISDIYEKELHRKHTIMLLAKIPSNLPTIQQNLLQKIEDICFAITPYHTLFTLAHDFFIAENHNSLQENLIINEPLMELFRQAYLSFKTHSKDINQTDFDVFELNTLIETTLKNSDYDKFYAEINGMLLNKQKIKLTTIEHFLRINSKLIESLEELQKHLEQTLQPILPFIELNEKLYNPMTDLKHHYFLNAALEVLTSIGFTWVKDLSNLAVLKKRSDSIPLHVLEKQRLQHEVNKLYKANKPKHGTNRYTGLKSLHPTVLENALTSPPTPPYDSAQNESSTLAESGADLNPSTPLYVTPPNSPNNI